MKANSSIDVQTISFPSAQGLGGLSDHRNYWQYGYPAVMINDTSFLRNPNYHQNPTPSTPLTSQRWLKSYAASSRR
jgi:hypothetical protein